jgi:hypothetical protein
MTTEEEKLKKIAALRELLEDRAKNLEAELEGLRILLDFINDLLLEKSFKRVEEIGRPAAPKPLEAITEQTISKESIKVIPLKTSSGILLANMFIEGNSIRIVTSTEEKFDINTPPFTAFFVEKILSKMREADQDLVKKGEVLPNGILNFNIEKEGDIIREIIIRNVNPQREREIRSAIRWTLEKMYEKMKSTM